MKNYTITVNGTAYNVSVEENGSTASAPVAATPAPQAAAPAAAPAPAAKPAAAPAAAGSINIESPMPGTILDIKVANGASVKSGDVLCILEAMKMENDIVAPQDGTIASINVNKGDAVEAGQAIISMS